MSAEFPIQLLEELIAVQPESKPPGIKIVLPDWSRTLRGTVIATWPGAKSVAVGDVVGFTATTGMESVFDGKTIRIMRESDIDFVVDP